MYVEGVGGAVHQRSFPGRQGRLTFAYLVCERGRPDSRAELVDLLWPRKPAAATDAALSAIISKLRGLLTRAGVRGTSALSSADGCHAPSTHGPD